MLKKSIITSEYIYYLFPILGSVCGAMLWLNYFIKIDILQQERIRDISIAMIIGFLTPDLALWIYKLQASYAWDFNGDFMHDLFYAVFGIGLTEEITKLIGVLLALFILRKRLTEPINYLIFGGIVALGFAIRENYIYYYNYGSQIITGRTLISSLIHIINTSICIYGIFRLKLFKKGKFWINAIAGVSIAVVSHGLFDFFLTQQFIGKLTPFLATGIYLIGINFWIQMLNNSINFSPFFNYEKLLRTTKMYQTILGWYGGLLLIEFIYNWHFKTFEKACEESFFNLFKEGLLLLIVALRVSRLKLSKRKYFKIKLQLPIYITKNNDEDFNLLGLMPLKIRGENEKEIQFFKYMEKLILVCPLNLENSKIKINRKGRLIKKYFLKHDVVTYLLELEEDEYNDEELFILKPKTYGITNYNKQYPIASLYSYEEKHNLSDLSNPPSYKDLNLTELVFIKDYRYKK